MCVQKTGQRFFIAFTGFTQHPAAGLVHQVVTMGKKLLDKFQRIGKISFSDKGQCGNNGYPLFPEIFTVGQLIQDRPVFVQEPLPHNVASRHIHQVPIIDTVSMGQIKLKDFFTTCVAGFLKLFRQNDQSTKTTFVIPVIQQFFEFVKRKVFIGFGHPRVQGLNAALESAISDRRCIAFDYRNAAGRESRPHVEPLAIHYKWYAWYLFAWSEECGEYRTFKVARIRNLEVSERRSRIDHGDVEQRMKESEQAYYRTCIDIEVRFPAGDAPLMEEYFPDCPMERLTEDTGRIFIRVPAKERLWKALLLSFGDRVTVVGPEAYREELKETARKFLSNYDI